MEKHYYNLLNHQEQKAYEQIYTSLMMCLPDARFPKMEYMSCDFGKVFRYINLEHPELYFVDFVRFQASHSMLECVIKFSYLFEKSEVNRISMEISRKCKEIISKFNYSTASEYEKETFIHDYLTKNICYDHEALNHSVDSFKSLYAHSIADVFLDGKAVCDGISKAFLFLAKKIGLSAIVVTGTAALPTGSGPHAWNIVRVENENYHLDVTADLTGSSNAPIPLNRYFNVNDSQMRTNHSWNDYETPRCRGDKYNYYVFNKLECRNSNELMQTINKMLLEGKETFLIRYNGPRTDVVQAVSNLIKSCNKGYRGYGLSEVPDMRIFIISLQK